MMNKQDLHPHYRSRDLLGFQEAKQYIGFKKLQIWFRAKAPSLSPFAALFSHALFSITASATPFLLLAFSAKHAASYRTNYFIMIVFILGLGFLRRPLAIVAAMLTALTVAFLNDWYTAMLLDC